MQHNITFAAKDWDHAMEGRVDAAVIYLDSVIDAFFPVRSLEHDIPFIYLKISTCEGPYGLKE